MKTLNIIFYATKDQRLTHSDLRVFLTLLSYNGAKRIFPSLETISKATGIKSIYGISRSLHHLQKMNYIKIRRRKHQSNLYEIVNSFKNEIKPIKEMKTTKPKPESKSNPYTWVIVEIYKNMTGADTSPAYAMVNKLLKLRSDLDHLRGSLLLMSILKANESKVSHEKFNGIIYNSFRESSYSQLRQKFDEVPIKNNGYEIL